MQGTFFIEIMAGECVITLGVLLKIVPCFRPWDIRWLPEDGRIDSFLALPCQSFTFARDPALRDAAEPLGKSGLSARQQELVDLGNEIAAWTLKLIKATHASGGHFAVENPYL